MTRLPRRLLNAGQAGDARSAGGRRMVGNAGVELVGRVIAICTGLITLPLLARTLGTNGFGTWSAALAYIGLFAAVSEFGLMHAAMLRMSAEPEHEAQWLGALSSLRTVTSLVLATLCAAGIPLFLPGSGHVRVVALILTFIVVFSGALALQAVFRSRLRPSIPLALSILQSLSWLAIVIVLATTNAGVVTAAIAYTGMLGTMAFLQVAAARRAVSVSWRGGRDHWRPLLRIAVPIGLGGLFVTIYYSIDAILLYRLAGAHETGLYGAAARFLDPLVTIPSAVMGALFPVISAHWGRDHERVQELFQRGADYMAVISLPAVATTLVLSGPIVALFFGSAYHETAGLMPILMLAFIGVCYGNLAGFLAPVFGLQWRITLYALAGAVANIGLNLWLIPKHGAYAAAWVTVVTETLTTVLLLGTELRRSDLRIGSSRILRTVLAAAGMAGVMLLLRPVGLAPALVLGGLAYLALIVVLNVIPAAELRALRRRRA